jgi:predicted TIM-barrel fold metal-dependent hydrolase
MTDPKYYDPQGLENVVLNYDGAHGLSRVNFVLSHVGQGDARAVEHALLLAEKHDNVYLEISALKRPLLIDSGGNSVQETEYQYPYVIDQIKKRGLIARTLWATDGPQFSGMVKSYLQIMVQGMKDAGYTVDEIAAVLAGNFNSLYFQDATQ